MEYKEQLNSRIIFNVHETRRKQKLFHKKIGKAWHSKKEYIAHFFSTRFGRKKTDHTKESVKKKDQTQSLTTPLHIPGKNDSDNPGKLAVYTCVFGGYDTPKEPLIKSEYCDYYIITDVDVSDKSAWKRIIPKQYPEGFETWHPAIKNRYYKMHPDELFPDYKYSLYIDGNIRPITDLYPFLIQMVNAGKIIGLFKHPICRDVYEMADMVKSEDLVNREEAEAQMNRYKNESFPEQWGLFECNFILRMHINERCKSVMHTWWQEYFHGEKRDQLSFTYALWKNGMQFSEVCCFGKNIRHNSRLKLREHNRPHSIVEQK